jgi:predicted HTH transcriptional regulator
MREMVKIFGVDMAYELAREENNLRRRAKVAERRRRMVEVLKADPKMTVAKMAERFKVSERTAKRDRASARGMLTKHEFCPICGHALHEKVDT